MVKVSNYILSFFLFYTYYLINLLKNFTPFYSHLFITTARKHPFQYLYNSLKLSWSFVFSKVYLNVSFEKIVHSLWIVGWNDHKRMLFEDNFIENYAKRPNVWKIIHFSIDHKVRRSVLSSSSASSICWYFKGIKASCHITLMLQFTWTSQIT